MRAVHFSPDRLLSYIGRVCQTLEAMPWRARCLQNK
jgi:hypothetical protein